MDPVQCSADLKSEMSSKLCSTTGITNSDISSQNVTERSEEMVILQFWLLPIYKEKKMTVKKFIPLMNIKI